jgi:hypothetical protein
MKRFMSALAIIPLVLIVALPQSRSKRTAKQARQATKVESPFEFETRPLQEWETAASSNLLLFEYNTKTIKRTAATAEAWFKLRPNLEGLKNQQARNEKIEEVRSAGYSVKGYDRWSHTVALYEFRCSSREFNLLELIDYDTGGDVLLTLHLDKPEWHNIAPDTVNESMLRAVCRTSVNQY